MSTMHLDHLKHLATLAPDLPLERAVPIIDWISGMLGPSVQGAQTPDFGAGVATTMTHAHPAPAPEVAASGAGDDLLRGRWTEAEEDRAWQLKAEGLTARQIAQQLGRPFTATEVKLKAIKAERMSAAMGQHGLTRSGERVQNPPWSQDEIDRGLEMREAGASFAEISAKLGRTAKACEVAIGRERRVRAKAARATEAEVVEAPPLDPPAPDAVVVTEGEAEAAPQVAQPVEAPPDPRLTMRQQQLVRHIAGLSNDFTPADDLFLVRELATGTPGNIIADQLGCDLKAAARRFRALQIDDIVNHKGALTIDGQRDLLVAVKYRAECHG